MKGAPRDRAHFHPFINRSLPSPPRDGERDAVACGDALGEGDLPRRRDPHRAHAHLLPARRGRKVKDEDDEGMRMKGAPRAREPSSSSFI